MNIAKTIFIEKIKFFLQSHALTLLSGEMVFLGAPKMMGVQVES
jgi:hypothetical protein